MRALLVVALLPTNAHAIVGGSPSADPSVVALVRGEAGAQELACSGTVIASHAILTAAHCVASDDLPDVMVGGDRFQPSIAFVAPDFDPTTRANDVAVLVFFTTTLPPAPRSLAPSAPPIGAAIDLVGFGRTAPDDVAPFMQRTGSATITESSTSGIVSQGPAFTCEGDSGGPALVDGFVVGVTSSGDASCAALSRHARVEDQRAFIEDVVERTRPRSARAGDRCWYETNCIEGACRPAIDEPRLSFCTPFCLESTCPGDLVCIEALCVHPTPSPGATGAACSIDDECIDELCVTFDGDDASVCAARCFTELPGFDCPVGTRCAPVAGGGEACLLDRVGSGCCSSSRGSAVGSLVLAMLVLAQLLRGRVTP